MDDYLRFLQSEIFNSMKDCHSSDRGTMARCLAEKRSKEAAAAAEFLEKYRRHVEAREKVVTGL